MIPSVLMVLGSISLPEARAARITIFLAASIPSTSAEGLASAYPSFCAAESASAKDSPLSLAENPLYFAFHYQILVKESHND